MSQANPSTLSPHAVVDTLRRHPRRWIVPTILITAAAAGYALFKSPQWEATQAMMIRDEAVGSFTRPGRFESVDSMQTAQETVLEVAKSRAVVESALQQVNSLSRAPSQTEIERLTGAIKIAAPNGAEFGRTEVFYLKVKDTDRQRAAELAAALSRQLELRLKELRDQKTQSLVDELEHTAALARTDLEAVTAELSAREREVGTDLAELRILSELSSGESNLRRTLVELNSELRQVETTRRTHQQLLEMLIAAQDDPTKLVATPNRLLDSQPSLRLMKDGLVTAQLQSAQLLGDMTPDHPKVRAAQVAQSEIRRHLHNELNAAVSSLRAELVLDDARTQSLEGQVAEINGRMTRLAEVRAGYGNVLAQVAQRSETLNRAEKDLADARASHAAAHSASLLTLLDSPVAGDHPVGPRKSMIVAAGLFGGFLTGLGCLFLTTAPIGRANVAAAGQPVVAPAETPPAHKPSRSSRPAAMVRGLDLKQALRRIMPYSPSHS